MVEFIGLLSMAQPRKPPAACKNLEDISRTSQVIAYFVSNIVAMATGVGRGGICLTSFNSPTNRRALGIYSFHRNHVEGFAGIAKPMTDLTGSKISSQFQLTAEARDAFRELQSKVCTAPVLVSLRFGEPFCLYTDASQFAVGCCLAQADESGTEFPIAYGSQLYCFASPLECDTIQEFNVDSKAEYTA